MNTEDQSATIAALTDKLARSEPELAEAKASLKDMTEWKDSAYRTIYEISDAAYGKAWSNGKALVEIIGQVQRLKKTYDEVSDINGPYNTQMRETLARAESAEAALATAKAQLDQCSVSHVRILEDRDNANDDLSDLVERYNKQASALATARHEMEEAKADAAAWEEHLNAHSDDVIKCHTMIQDLDAQLAAATARCGELEGDKRRLDWLGAQYGIMLSRGVKRATGAPVFDVSDIREEGLDDACGEELGSGPSLRHAIDAAIRAAAQPPVGTQAQGEGKERV